MRLYGISMVRNEADIFRTNLLYHLSIGFDRIFVLDDGSTDGTDRILDKLAAEDPRLWWESVSNERFRQGEVFTELARRAHREGADWVVPIDADDFWSARNGDFKDVLASAGAGSLRVQTVDFIQRRRQRESSPDALLHMTRRVAEPVPRKSARDLLDEGKTSYVAMARVPRWIFRPSATVTLTRGAHKVEDIEEPSEDTNEIFCMHAPLRSRAALEAKARSAERRGKKGNNTGFGPGWLYSRWNDMQTGGRLDEEWAANSYRNNSLGLGGESVPLLFDPTFRDAVRPYLETESRWKRWLYRR